MSVAKLISELESVGVRLWEESGKLHFRAPKGIMTEERRAALLGSRDAVLDHLRNVAEGIVLIADEEARYRPFPLTDVQGAYLLGRRLAFAYGGVACHAYGEVAVTELDPERLERAWQVLIHRHDMLRAVIDSDGAQRVLPEVPAYRIAIGDLRGAGPTQVEEAIAAVRAELDHKMHAPNEWPLFELRVTLTAEKALVHLSIDFLIADYVSIHILLGELGWLYREPGVQLPSLAITFRDYQLAERRLRAGSRYERDREYWWKRIDELAPAPELPLVEGAETNANVRFRRWKMTLPREQWIGFRQRAGQQGITASGAMLAAYAEVIGRWSRRPHFTLDITLMQRLPLHPQVPELVGDFTSVSLLSVGPENLALFRDRAQSLQAQLWQDMDHRLCSGIEVLREIARRRGARAALMPVVFTSAIGLNHPIGSTDGKSQFGELVHGISQTPQVWIDCQVMERGDGLDVNWDVRDGVFPRRVVDDMFGAFEVLLGALSRDHEAWESPSPVGLPVAQREQRRKVNDTAAPLSQALLHEGVVAQALRMPERLAVVDGSLSLSYGGLFVRAAAVAEALREAGCRRQDIVGVLMDKGVEQVIAVLGTLLAGAAYLPIDTNQPAVRRNHILTDAHVRQVLTQSWLSTDNLPSSLDAIPVDTMASATMPASTPLRAAGPDDLAYVIYTSGSTGTPKGVMITHRSAVNTIQDINRRFAIGEHDRILGLAQLGFDLSVYDIFGLLAAGGCLVLPDSERRADPSHWAQLIAEKNVTVWNTVPAQLQMLHDYLSANKAVNLPSLRLGLLSGDWIPVTLPDRVRERLPGVELVSLGGATEAAIWSIFYPIGLVSTEWRSIPYGTPLTNQTFHVLDPLLRPCPDLTPGELYIGGTGLAVGYLGDEQRTVERFIHHPESGERLYRTGDFGRYWPDGTLEFLGREDFQVKIRGQRIELAEIEAALQSHPAVAAAAVFIAGEEPLEKRIFAAVETAHRESGDPQSERTAYEVGLAAKAAAAAITAEADCEGVVRFANQLDRTALLSMVYALRQQGLFARPEDAHSRDEILERARVVPRHHRLLRRWLNALESHHLLERDLATACYHHAWDVDAAMVEQAWREVERLQPEVDRRTELMDYFRLAGSHLPELMRGELNPIELLFPNGSVEIHEVAYNDSFLGRYLNRMLTASVCRIAAGHSGGRSLQVLEAGAGVGGTSVELIPALAKFDCQYTFSDVSNFFLNNASERFRGYPWVSYRLFDINIDYRSQGFNSNSFDVIVCANVLHYARNAGAVLNRLREMLKPQGWLVFIDMVRDNYQVLTSMEFLFDETVGDFEDVRRGRDETFINLEQWYGLLGAAGARSITCLPHSEDLLAKIGFHLFVAQVKDDRKSVDAGELTAHLAERLPEYMLPSRMEVVDALPLSENGKVDRKTLRTWFSNPTIRPAGVDEEPPASDLERRLAEVWARVLGVERVGREQDFFELGGDSLLAAQLVGRVREEVPESGGLFFDGLLRALLEGPTVAKLAARLQTAEARRDGEETRPQTSAFVHLGGAGDGPVRVLLHDGSGTLASYTALIGELNGRGPLAGLVVNDVQTYLDTQPSVLFESRAACYARVLQVQNPERLHLIGFDVAGILATEVARHLAEAGFGVEGLTIVSSLPLSFSIDDELLVEYLFIRYAGVDPVKLGFPSEAALGRGLESIRADTLERVPAGRLGALTGDSEMSGVAWCFRRLGSYSVEDRFAAMARAIAPKGQAPAALGQISLLYQMFRQSLRAFSLHEVSPYAGDITLLRPIDESPLRPGLREDMANFWRERCLGDLRIVDVPGDFCTCLKNPNATQLTELVLVASGSPGRSE